MSIKRKERKIRNIAKLYLTSITHNYPTIKNGSFLSAVELAYASLSAPLQKIINNDFFYQDYPGWWRLVYKKNNYNRLRINAINNFLEAFYEI